MFWVSSILVHPWINRVCELEMGGNSKSLSSVPDMKVITRKFKVYEKLKWRLRFEGEFRDVCLCFMFWCKRSRPQLRATEPRSNVSSPYSIPSFLSFLCLTPISKIQTLSHCLRHSTKLPLCLSRGWITTNNKYPEKHRQVLAIESSAYSQEALP